MRTAQAGQASGATNAIRELGGVLGIAVLSTVFTAHGSYASPQAFIDMVSDPEYLKVHEHRVAALKHGDLIATSI